jgi:hypothetical protein
MADAEIKDVSADLGAISPSIWDRNHDGFISTDECRTTLEVVFGIVLENGSRLHLKNGHVMNLGMFRQFDTDNDNKLSRHEFVSKFSINVTWTKVVSGNGTRLKRVPK